ncbi:MAG: hypothetical protein Q7R96_04395 [Nanoarchaeota archaeon]|nr:hypothetical protein [Nanoarchaeota archaeon]
MNLRQRYAVGGLLAGITVCYLANVPSIEEDDFSDVRQVVVAFWKPPREKPLFGNMEDLGDHIRTFIEDQEERRTRALVGEMLYVDVYSQHPTDYGAACDVFDDKGKTVTGGSSMSAEPGGAGLESSISISRYPSGTRFEIVAEYLGKDKEVNATKRTFVNKP